MTDPRTEQAEHLARVAAKLDDVILAFCRERFTEGRREFTLADLAAHCMNVAGGAPDSASRILRSLRQRRAISYEVVNRRESRYRILGIGGARDAA